MAFEFIQSSPICKAALLTAGYQLMFFLPTAVFRMDKLTDFAGASNFAVLALWSYMGYSSFSTRQKWITSLLVLWSARLALYLGYRIWFVFGEDRRLDSFRDNIFKLMGFWTLQGLWAFVVSLPAVLCNMNSQIRPVGRLDYCGNILSKGIQNDGATGVYGDIRDIPTILENCWYGMESIHWLGMD
ncbi:hypothetical protein Gasu2_51010 [Galdieria sulphuraria]|nr:hypothetical protein Gasu2_51010 [Galdieria sulphuraria]